MSEKIDRLRSWLERNKIFFDTSTTLLLALMTITVSISANAIAQNQNNLMKEENQPIFRFNLIEDYKDKNNSPGTVETLRIYNDGKPIYDFSAQTYGFLEVNVYEGPFEAYFYSTGIVNPYISVYNFYETPRYTTSSVGLVATLSRSNLSNNLSNLGAEIIIEDEDAMLKDVYNNPKRDILINSNTSTTLEIINKDLISYLLEKEDNYDWEYDNWEYNDSEYIDSEYIDSEYNDSEYNDSEYDDSEYDDSEYDGEVVDLYTYVLIYYTDIYGEDHSEIYWVNKWGAGKLSEEEWTVLEEINHQCNSIPYFMYIPPAKVIELLSESTYKEDWILLGHSWLDYYFVGGI